MSHLGASRPTLGLLALRWTIRALTIASIGLMSLMLTDGWPPKSAREWGPMILFPGGVMVGMAIGWWRELLGALVAAASLGGFYLVLHFLGSGTPTGVWILVFASPGLLFALPAAWSAASRSDPLVRGTLVGLFVSAALALGKLVAGIAGHSTALVADSVESLADTVGSIIVWRGIRVAGRPPDRDHPYGYGKAEAVSVFCVGSLLLLACVIIVVEAVERMLTPHAPPAAWTLLVLVAVVGIKEWLFRRITVQADLHDSDAARADAWHHRSDAITSFAAFVGVTVAICGPPLLDSPHLALADEAAAMVASGIILVTGVRLIRRSIRELLDAASPAMAA